VAAQKVFAARLEGRDMAAEKQAARRRVIVDRVERPVGDLHRATSGAEPVGRGDCQAAAPGIGSAWAAEASTTSHKRDVVAGRLGGGAARSGPAPPTSAEVDQDIPALVCRPSHSGRVPSRRHPVAQQSGHSGQDSHRPGAGAGHPGARQMGGPYGGIVELLALTGQRGGKLRK